MSGNYTGRGNNAGPATEFFPLSGATASSPGILITATTATGGGTTIHTADANAQDVLFITISNVSAAALTGHVNLGSLATTGNIQKSISAATFEVFSNGNASISKSGVVSGWTTASTGLYVYGYVARTYTATS